MLPFCRAMQQIRHIERGEAALVHGVPAGHPDVAHLARAGGIDELRQRVVDGLAVRLAQVDADQGFTNRFMLVHTDADFPLKHGSEIDKRVPDELANFMQRVGTAGYELPISSEDQAKLNAIGEERLIATGSVTKSIITLADHASS